MNTDVRRSIFCVLCGSADYLDCFERLLRLPLRRTQQREIVHVLVDCCAQEKRYNPYYAHVAIKLCESHPSFKFTFQLTYWDMLKDVSAAPMLKLANLGRLLAHLFRQFSLSMSILKVLDFSKLADNAVIFLQLTLADLLAHVKSDADVKTLLQRMASTADGLEVARDGLSLFFHKHMRRGDLRAVCSSLSPEKQRLLVQRVKTTKKHLGELGVLGMR